MPSQDEIKRRLDSARQLRGVSQTDLAPFFVEIGLGKGDVGRIERGDLEIRRVHVDALTRYLRIPEWWLTAESADFDRYLLAARRPPTGEEIKLAVEVLAAAVLISLPEPDTDS